MTDRDAWVPCDERLAAIRERESKATPGPWTGDPEPFAIYIYGADGSMVADTNVPGKYADPDDRAQPNFEDGERGGIDAVLRLRGVGASKSRPKGSLVHNYAFMIHARDDVRWLLAELTTAQAALAAARAEVDELNRERDRVESDYAAVCDDLTAAHAQLHRFQHGAEIESDHLCQAALDLLAARAEVEALRERERALIDAAHAADNALRDTEGLGQAINAAIDALEPVRLWSYPLDRSATKPAGEG